jgi:hypothetical protein
MELFAILVWVSDTVMRLASLLRSVRTLSATIGPDVALVSAAI